VSGFVATHGISQNITDAAVPICIMDKQHEF
jgi:hypothetical protein